MCWYSFSLDFLFIFLPITVAVFYLVSAYTTEKYAILWLVAASLYFYGYWNINFLLLIIISIMVNFSFGMALSKIPEGRQRKMLLIGGIGFNLSLIFYYKYAYFLLNSFTAVTGVSWSIGEILLPIGISFFTFQQIAYLVDTSQGVKREKSFVNYMLYVVFFPQLIAGPIVHHTEILKQFKRKGTFHPALSNFCIGGTIFIIGLFKKVVIADNIAVVASPAFTLAELGDVSFFQAWQGAFAYTFQLYFDFSGYSDMAIGLARLFGVKLPLNFNSPYKAVSIVDFWRRWHMTLSRFLRDYLYIALGGNRKGPSRRYVNLFLTMLLGGLWHGAAWTYVAWGGLHGFYLVVNHLWNKYLPRAFSFPGGVFCARLITLFAVMFAWVLFRAESFEGALVMFDAMRTLPSSFGVALGGVSGPLEWIGIHFTGVEITDKQVPYLYWLCLWMGVVWYLPNTQEWMASYRPTVDKILAAKPTEQLMVFRWKPALFYGVIVALFFTTGLLHLQQVSEFLYFQF